MRTHNCFPADVSNEIWERYKPEGFKVARAKADERFKNRTSGMTTSESEQNEEYSPSI